MMKPASAILTCFHQNDNQISAVCCWLKPTYERNNSWWQRRD